MGTDKRPQKLAIIGLDCAAPELVFETFRDELPVLSALMGRGVRARLRSIVPPITVPAWSCLASGAEASIKRRIIGERPLTERLVAVDQIDLAAHRPSQLRINQNKATE